MTQELECPNGYDSDADIPQLPIDIKKLGLASHHYGTKEKRKDFKDDFLKILKIFDSNEHKCNSVLFSSYTLKTISLEAINLPESLQDLCNIRLIFFEELLGVYKRKSRTRYHMWMKHETEWVHHICHQSFGTVKTAAEKKCAANFVDTYSSKRVSGNYALMLCGEINVLKCVDKCAQIIDPHDIKRRCLHPGTVILNPSHDRMVRFEMNEKRKDFSRSGRRLVSVWNEGKVSNKQGSKPRRLDAKFPWVAFEDNLEITEQITPLDLPPEVNGDVRLAVLEV